MNDCLVCHQPVNWEKVLQVSDAKAVLDRADVLGPYSLSESDQLLYEGLICEDHVGTDMNVLAAERDAEAVKMYLAWAVCHAHATYLYSIGVTAGACPVCKEINRGTR